MHVLSISEILLFYDVPELFVAHDQLGTTFVCHLVELEEDTHRYLCVPVSKDRLVRLMDGRIDVRQLLESPETGEVFEGEALDGDLGQIETRAIGLDEVPPEWLPDPDYFLDLEPIPNVRVVEESKERNRAVIHWTLRPPESAEEPKITAAHLGEGVRLFQGLVRWAYSKALRDVGASIRDLIDSPANYQLEVFGFSPGSFTIHMQTAAQADLVGYSHVARALEILDAVSYDEQDIDRAVELVADYGGHFATHYKKLLRFVVDNQIPVSYEWSMPIRHDSTRRQLPREFAEPLYEALIKRADIGREERRLLGVLTKVDRDNRTWRLLDDEHRQHNGHVDPAAAVTLAGLVIETKRYEFICEERLEEEQATGKEFTKLFLMSYREL